MDRLSRAEYWSHLLCRAIRFGNATEIRLPTGMEVSSARLGLKKLKMRSNELAFFAPPRV
jgi:hypothetical protein